MKRPRSARPVAVALVGLALIITAAAFLPGGVELTIAPREGGRPILVVPLEPGERFTLHYYHSVEEAPIWEELSVDAEGTIYIEEERYLKFGAGLGHIPGRGRLGRRGPYEVIEDMHHPLGEFVLRVGSLGVDHTIVWRGARVNLSRVAAGQAVTVRARPINLLRKLWRLVWPDETTPKPGPKQD